MKELFVKYQELELCTHYFGSPINPAVVLISGAAGQSILWNKIFCQNIANAGYFVIRFDSRDTGLSSGINYNDNPYNLKDMASDIGKILNHFNIKKAHIVGMSMGGYVAQNLAIHFPEHVLSLTYIMTTINSLSLRGIRQVSKLPGQDPQLVKEMSIIYQTPRLTLEDRIKTLTDTWQLFNGNASHFPYQEWYQLAEESYKRAKSNNAVRNHRQAILNSPADRTNDLKNISIPTLIIHGEVDPIIKVEHALYTKQCLPHAKLLIIKKMGHILSSVFTNQVEDALLSHFRNGDLE